MDYGNAVTLLCMALNHSGKQLYYWHQSYSTIYIAFPAYIKANMTANKDATSGAQMIHNVLPFSEHYAKGKVFTMAFDCWGQLKTSEIQRKYIQLGVPKCIVGKGSESAYIRLQTPDSRLQTPDYIPKTLFLFSFD